MNLRLLTTLFLGILFLYSSSQLTFSKTPDEECTDATTNIQGSTCKACGDCAVITLRTGEKLYKKCNEYQCDLANSPEECSDPTCASE
ncbi:MAG: hypothetical protein HYY52_06005 [Candidatus Melainabacteria bacterium]|nr:hypothetical protein [Candidatus Melainabacteria bacterium]